MTPGERQPAAPAALACASRPASDAASAPERSAAPLACALAAASAAETSGAKSRQAPSAAVIKARS